MQRGVRKSITIPGSLASAVKQRCREFGYASFTPYAVELVCYDLRSDAKHAITLAIANDTQAAQDAVDRELVARYRPGQQREGLLVQLVERIGQLQGVADRSLSAYVTGLIRYDLLVSGPHSTITADCRSKIQRALTRKTLAARRKGDRRKILLDHLIERAEGRSVTDEELEKMKAQIAETLRNISLGS